MEGAYLGMPCSGGPDGMDEFAVGYWHRVIVTPIGEPYCLASALIKKITPKTTPSLLPRSRLKCPGP